MTTHQPSGKRRDIHAEITTKLIASIEQRPGNLQLPWRRSSGPLFMPVNARTEKDYNGIIIVSLWVAAEVRGFAAPLWATYRQWQGRLSCSTRRRLTVTPRQVRLIALVLSSASLRLTALSARRALRSSMEANAPSGSSGTRVYLHQQAA